MAKTTQVKCPIEGCTRKTTLRGLSRHLGEAHKIPLAEREPVLYEAESVTAKKATPPTPVDPALKVLRIAFPNGIPVSKLDEAVSLRDTIRSL